MQILADAIRRRTCVSLVLSKKCKRSPDGIDKVTLRPVLIRGVNKYQLTSHHDCCQRHENLDAEHSIRCIDGQFGEVFEHCHLFTIDADYEARVKRDGTVKVTKRPASQQIATCAHNRKKQYLLPENVACPFLVEIGVMTESGKVRSAKYQKFRQINRFLELVDDVLQYLPIDGPWNVVDFGCGKSYLTFAVHHLMTEIHNREVHIVGLDRNVEVIRQCSLIADRLDSRGLEFQVGDIADHSSNSKVHLAVSLHACDTATDLAIAKAVQWQCDVILAVPCCQHELAGKIRTGILQPVLEHGFLKDQLAAIATDALRAKSLEIFGYRTQVIEFIDLEHTAKNTLIRAVRQPDSKPQMTEPLDAYRKLKQLLGLERLELEKALGQSFIQRLHEST